MTNSELYYSIYSLLMKKGDLSCSQLEFKLHDQSKGMLINILDADNNVQLSAHIDLNLLEANSILESLEYPYSPFGNHATKCILVKTGENRICQLRRHTSNMQNGRILFTLTEDLCNNGLANEIGLTDALIKLLNSCTSSDSGLVICNGKQIESRLALQTLYPQWVHISHEEFKKNATIDKAFVYIKDFDPVALATSILENCEDRNMRISVADRIKCVVSLIPVKKQCGACAKPTPIPQSSRNQFPFFLVEQVPTSYLFSRGCERCEYRSYKGLTFLESFFANRHSFLKEMAINLNPEAIFERAREMGLHIFHESGLEKIKSGVTSLEQVTEHTPPVEPAFSELLNSTSIEKNRSVPSQADELTKSQRSILIVEDDSDQREILQLVFSKEGFNVYTADNGKSALEVLKFNSVQIVLSDIMMPIMNGLQLVRILKNNADFKNIPVLMLTASSNPDHEVKLLEEGADDYCAKNVKKKVLITRVERLIDKFKSASGKLDHFLT